MNREAIEAAVTANATKAMYVGAGSAGLGAWMLSNWMSLAGLLLGLVGYVTNWYFKRAQDRRDQERREQEKVEHEARMRKYQLDFDPLPRGKKFGDET